MGTNAEDEWSGENWRDWITTALPTKSAPEFISHFVKFVAEQRLRDPSAILAVKDDFVNEFKRFPSYAMGYLDPFQKALGRYGGLPGQSGGLSGSGCQNTGAANDDSKAAPFAGLVSKNEGIDGITYFVSRRTSTVDSVLQLAERLGVVFVQGPPFSGKTALMQLIHTELKRRGRRCLPVTMAGSGPMSFSERFQTDYSTPLAQICSSATPNDPVYVLVDEVQQTYHNSNPDDANDIWGQIKLRTSSGFAPRSFYFILFGLYNKTVPQQRSSPVALDEPHMVFIHPRTLGVAAAPSTPETNPSDIQLPGLFFTLDEAATILEEFAKSLGISVTAPEGAVVSQYILVHTGLHPGLLRHTLEFLWQRLRKIASSQDLPVKVYQLLTQHEYLGSVMSLRGFISFADLSPSQQEVCDRIWQRNRYVHATATGEMAQAVHDLIRTGLVCSDPNNSYVYFQNQAYASAYVISRFGSPVRARHAPNEFIKFLQDSFRRMRTSKLVSTESVHVDHTISEKTWHAEWYHAATSLLPADCTVSYEYPVPDAERPWNHKKHGFMDFSINSDLCYGIEFVMDDSDLAGDRFDPTTGTYRSLLSALKAYAVVNVRSPQAKELTSNMLRPKWIYLKTSADFEKFQMIRVTEEVKLEITDLAVIGDNIASV